MISFEDYRKYDALGLAELVRTGQVTAAELLECAIARAAQVNPKLNAIVRLFPDKARARSQENLQGPFAGVPFLLKDLINEYAGEITSQGSRFFQDYVPQQDSELVARYKKAGLVIFGKTNTPELGLTPWTESQLLGPARNPWNTDHTPGGSSGGAAAAIAAGIVPMANGGDGGGSIRVPAACCGLVGFKPTRGRIPTGPMRGDLWQGSATEHVLSRTVRDTAAALDATGGIEPGGPYQTPPPTQSYLEQIKTPPRKLRIAFSGKPMMGTVMHTECITGMEATAKLLTDLGHEVVEAAPPLPREEFVVAFGRMIAMETAGDFAMACKMLGVRYDKSRVEPNTEALRRIGCAMTGEEAGMASRTLAYCTREIGRWFESYDVLLQPTLGMPPFRIGDMTPGALESLQLWLVNHLPIAGIAKSPKLMLDVARKTFDWMTNTGPYNVTGQPSISLPLHWSADGLPVGMMLTSRFAEDGLLLQLAAQIEQARPWFNRHPGL